MVRYYCTCTKEMKTPHDYQHTKYYPTEVNKDGACIHCGYYAFTRASVKHELFPRHGKKVTAMEVYKNVSDWKDNNLYHQYFNGCDSYAQGLARETLLKDQKRIQNGKQKTTERKAIAPTNFNRYKRVSVDSSRPSDRD